MLRLQEAVIRLMLDCRGQDMVEYALMAAFVAVSAGAIMPNAAAAVCGLFSQVTSNLALANSTS